MQGAVLTRLPEVTIVIKAAAVADFRVSQISQNKIHRDGPRTLELEPTEDIVRSVVDHRRAGTLVIAFAAEMGLDVERAREKLHRKGADAIVLNDITHSDLGFDSDRNAGVFITDEGAVPLPAASKDKIATRILDGVVALRSQRRNSLQPS